MEKERAAFFALAISGALFAAACSGPGTDAGTPEEEEHGQYQPINGGKVIDGPYDITNIHVEKTGGTLEMAAGSVRVVYDLGTGKADIYKKGAGAPAVAGFFAEAMADGDLVTSAELSRSGESVFLEEISDAFGAGVKIAVKNTGLAAGKSAGALAGIIIWQNFYAYRNRDYILLETVVESPAWTKTNYIAPVAAAAGDAARPAVTLGGAADPRFLFVPFDNDAFVRYASDPLGSAKADESYEVTAVFDNNSRAGFVTGSVSHDTWKTGIRARHSGSAVTEFRVIAGVTSRDYTRDIVEHGAVGGHQIYSPKIFFGFYDDWRDGMEEYGKANGIVAPPLPWDNGPPFGWNSWSAVADKVDYEIYVTASDFFKEELPEFANGKGIVYINFDSFWDRLTEDQRKAAAAKVKANGQHPGIYFTPFTFWGNADQVNGWGVEGTRYDYGAIVLRDQNKNVLRYPNGNMGIPTDPTHPGNVERVAYQLKKFVDWGFEYVKFDFMSHGSMEGEHYNKDIKTGIQAYNYGMKKLLEGLDEMGGLIRDQKFFVSLSIAPIFPAQYAHGRRISCDVFGTIDQAEYMLNSVTYGWWLNNSVYPYNDPDHIVVYNSYNHREAILYNEGLTRYVSSAISGAFMIDSDDIRLPEARERLKEIFANGAVNALAASGRTFRPAEGSTGDRAADLFVRDDRALDGRFYFAVFNFSSDRTKTMTVDFARIGLEPGRNYRMKDLISGAETTVSGSAAVTLAEAEPKIFEVIGE